MTTHMKEKFTGHLSALRNFKYAIKEQNGHINYNTCKEIKQNLRFKVKFITRFKFSQAIIQRAERADSLGMAGGLG